MATFFYRAVAKSGSVIEGTLDDASDKAVALKLNGMGLVPLEIGTKKGGYSWIPRIAWDFGGVRSKEVMFFTQELSTLVNAGLPLDRSLAICRQLSEKPKVQQMVESILDGIKQ